MDGVFNLWLVCLQTLLQLGGIFWETKNCLNKSFNTSFRYQSLTDLLSLFSACFVPWVSTSSAPSLGKQKQTLVSDTLVDEFWSFPYLSKFSPKYFDSNLNLLICPAMWQQPQPVAWHFIKVSGQGSRLRCLKLLPGSVQKGLPSLSLTAGTWKLDAWNTTLDGLFSGAVLVSGNVHNFVSSYSTIFGINLGQ